MIASIVILFAAVPVSLYFTGSALPAIPFMLLAIRMSYHAFMDDLVS